MVIAVADNSESADGPFSADLNLCMFEAENTFDHDVTNEGSMQEPSPRMLARMQPT